MSDCLFCKLVSGEIPSDVVFESEDVFAFKDINPQAPHHVLIIPKKHIATINDLDTDADAALITQLIFTATRIAKDLKIDQSGYRTVFNCNDQGGQDVYHIHLHLLGGRQMTWPPG